MIDIEAIYKKLTKDGFNIDEEKLKTFIKSIDEKKVEKEIKKQYKLKIWDKKSSINGIDAKTILDSRKYDVDSAYLIYINDTLVYFQDHNPNKEGYCPMSEEEAKSIGNNFIKSRVQEKINMQIYNNLFNIIKQEGADK